MAVDDVSLANRALTRCGALRIMSTTEDTKSGRAIAATFEAVRDSCLSIANWRFAMERLTLPAVTAQDGYSYAYRIPATWVRFVSIRDKYVGTPTLGPRYIQDPDADFVIETDRTLLTNFAPDLKAIGVKKVEDPSLFDPLFNDYFCLSLAVEIWEDVSRKNAGKLSTVIDERNRALSIARTHNAIQEAPEEIDDTAWLLARVGP